jgi:DHA2 family methylenomycin A resistance protein-like MFS transporter
MTRHRILSQRGFAAATATTSFGFFVVQLDVSIVNIALPRMGADLQGQMDALQWVVDGYTLAFASFLLSAGALADRIGARRVYVAGFALFTAASLACSLAPGLAWLIAARIVQGAGAALVMPSSLALLNHATAHDSALRARAIAWWTSAGSVALTAGPILGGVMVERLGWPSIFWVNLPVGIAGIWLALNVLSESPRAGAERGFDPFGQGLSCLGLFALVGAVIEAGERGWHAPIAIVGFAAGIALLIAFLIVEHRGAAPMLPLGLFRDRTFSAAILVGFAINLTIYGTIFVLGFYFQEARHYSAAVAGLAFMPFMALVGFSNLAAGRITARFGARLPMAVGLVIGCLGFALLVNVDEGMSYASLIWRLLLIPLGIGLAVPAMTSALLGTVPKERGGLASGILNTIRQVAGAIGVAAFGALIAGSLVHGMQAAFALAAVLLLVAAAMAGMVRAGPSGQKP